MMNSSNVEELPSHCMCKNLCSKKSGKRKGCSCKDQRKVCSESCLCGVFKRGKKVGPCKNIKDHPLPKKTRIEGDGHNEMESQIQQARDDILKIVEPLDRETLQNIVVEMGSVGSGSADYIDNLLKEFSEETNNSSNETTGIPVWCKCKYCKPMETEVERKCCGRKICLTCYQKFHKIVLDKDILEVAIIARADIRAENVGFDNAAYRKAAYYQYILWKYGKLGRSNRRVLPSCIVNMIRNQYPDPNNIYMGFKWS